MKSQFVAVLLLFPMVSLAAEHLQPKAAGIESEGYEWNAMQGEKLKALKLKGHADRGRKVYQDCIACHLPSGAGRSDGSFPQLAGQYATVIIKQLADVREGLRDNPVMYAHVVKLKTPQELADVAAYIERLPVPKENAKGPADDVALAKGESLYKKNCVSCHGFKGEGRRDSFFPVIAHQHYGYVLRQLRAIQNGTRRNSNRGMVKLIQGYTEEDLQAVSNYISRLGH